jgi:hypothetical protein
MHTLYPQQALTLADDHHISPALAFGLGEGCNLYYRRQLEQSPPHLLHILPSTFGEKVAARLAMPREQAIAEALAENAYGVMVCTGDWHGLDAIENGAKNCPFGRIAMAGKPVWRQPPP